MSPLSFVCVRLLASRCASVGECSRLRAVLPSFYNVSSSSVITAPNLRPRLLTKIASVILHLYSSQLLGLSQRLPLPVMSARAVCGCCCSSSAGVASCTVRLCRCNNNQ
ncbi:hypothetical protein HN51_063532 [Arachis hypogaea]